MSKDLIIGSERISLATLRTVWQEPVRVRIDDNARAAVRACRACVDDVLAADIDVYGINTGFGLLANVQVNPEDLVELQENLVLSHSAGVGAALDDDIVRLVLVLKIMSLAHGYSGISLELLDMLCALVNAEVYPVIPAKGSVGASGDLAPLAHLSGVLLGHGHARHNGQTLTARDALAAAGLRPVHLHPKEGLALLNGTQASTALALAGLFEAEDSFAAALVSGALSVDAMQGTDTPFDARIHLIRGQPGQVDSARQLLELLKGSDIRMSHVQCGRVQDPYSLRCQPQVMGACLDTMRHVASVLETEANAVTDNPLIFTADRAVLSGGNFHAEPVAFAADFLAIAIAEIGAISERRTALLVDPKMSGLPAFLVENSGLNSGFMIAQVTAAALASQNKALAHPASVDSIPTSANQEDHVSMATAAARRLGEMNENTRYIVAIELLAAAQGIEFHRPHTSSEILESVVGKIRQDIPHLDADRRMAPDIEHVAAWIGGGALRSNVRSILPSAA